MTQNEVERLRILLHSPGAAELFDLIRAHSTGTRLTLLDATELSIVFRAQGATQALDGLARTLEFIRDTQPHEEGTIPPAFP